ncbi:MAG: hypothetical protein A2018_07300 [Alphaproteobacteria bacterium GWF2_58_20]|nr:MAG: hypothetical protein A2018_07300 [Alphaproteobacteria bacterium GWF2_58_20]
MRVMVVDDVEMTQRLVGAMLRNMGISQVFLAGNGVEALDQIVAEPERVNTLLCDWNMPEMDGMALLSNLRQQGIDIPFVMMTGRNDEASVHLAKESGVDAYIVKPCCPFQLKEKLLHVHRK